MSQLLILVGMHLSQHGHLRSEVLCQPLLDHTSSCEENSDATLNGHHIGAQLEEKLPVPLHLDDALDSLCSHVHVMQSVPNDKSAEILLNHPRSNVKFKVFLRFHSLNHDGHSVVAGPKSSEYSLNCPDGLVICSLLSNGESFVYYQTSHHIGYKDLAEAHDQAELVEELSNSLSDLHSAGESPSEDVLSVGVNEDLRGNLF